MIQFSSLLTVTGKLIEYTNKKYRDMTTEEMHEYNKTQATKDLSYWSVCTTDFTIELRKFMTKWLDKAYEAGFNAAKEGKL